MSYKQNSCVYVSYKKNSCVYMSSNIERHIHTSVIFWWCNLHLQPLYLMLLCLNILENLRLFLLLPQDSENQGPGSYVESLTVIDSALWQESMIVEICQLESMDCWDHCCSFEWLAFSIFCKGNKWVFEFKYRDNVFDKRKSRLVASGYQKGKGRDFFESFSLTCS